MTIKFLKSKNRIGTNQYQRKPKGFQFKGYKEVAVICLVLAPVVYFGHMAAVKAQASYVSPLPQNPNVITVTPTPTITPVAQSEKQTSEHEAIVAYINEVFGKDAPKAFKLLSCENSSLNPRAVNRAGNYPVGSEDRGVFQINEYWQKVENPAFLFDYKINILIAHNIYERDNKSFQLWSCGKRLGI